MSQLEEIHGYAFVELAHELFVEFHADAFAVKFDGGTYGVRFRPQGFVELFEQGRAGPIAAGGCDPKRKLDEFRP